MTSSNPGGLLGRVKLTLILKDPLESQSQICSTMPTRQTLQAQHISPAPSHGERPAKERV